MILFICRYLNYGDPEWKAAAKECLAQMNTYSDEVTIRLLVFC